LVEASADGTVGGSHQALLDLARNFDRSRYTPVAIFYEDNRIADALRAEGVEVFLWKGVRNRSGAGGNGGLIRKLKERAGGMARCRAFLREQAIDIVHINNSPAIGWFDWLPAAHLLGIPCVAHSRAPAEAQSELESIMRRRFDCVIAISRFMDFTVRREGIPGDKVVLVYDGIDGGALVGSVRRKADEVRQSLGVSSEKLLVAMVGHLRSWKGQHIVLEALTHMPAELQRQICVVFVGGTAIDCGPYADSLRDTIRARGLEDCARLLGERSDAPEIMHAADVVLHASTDPEPFGLVVVEGMTLGKAVVASYLGGPGEVITPGSGIKFDPEAPEELAAVLAELVAHRDRVVQLGLRAQQRAAEFSARKTAAGVELVYEQLLRRRWLKS
jgi:glycosyltransferase involved in cell wall biosynthesis